MEEIQDCTQVRNDHGSQQVYESEPCEPVEQAGGKVAADEEESSQEINRQKSEEFNGSRETRTGNMRKAKGLFVHCDPHPHRADRNSIKAALRLLEPVDRLTFRDADRSRSVDQGRSEVRGHMGKPAGGENLSMRVIHARNLQIWRVFS